MFEKIRGLIFKLDPETAHNLAIKALKFNYIPNKKIQKNKILELDIFGKTIPNPVGIAAGFDKDAEVFNSLFNLGFELPYCGSGVIVPTSTNPNPNLNKEL